MDRTRVDGVEEIGTADGRNEDSRVSVRVLCLNLLQGLRLRLHLSLHHRHLWLRLLLWLLLLLLKLLLGELLLDGSLEGRLSLDRLLRCRLG